MKREEEEAASTAEHTACSALTPQIRCNVRAFKLLQALHAHAYTMYIQRKYKCAHSALALSSSYLAEGRALNNKGFKQICARNLGGVGGHEKLLT